MLLAAGTRLGPYEIVSPIGAGGMGEVYRAEDPRLGRQVAIKVLPHSVAGDPDRLHRFEQEARAVAALSHPNVLAIFDVGAGDRPYLVTELLDGETLRARLERGPLPLDRATDVALQLVAGLAAAHGRGIVHRDLKPDNVFMTRDGLVKILDFGLAKASVAAAGALDVTRASATTPGVLLGTVGYMAPEQVRGEAADPRSDIFAVGAILYEIVTGRRAFQRDSAADTISAVLREQPPDLVLRTGMPPALARLIRRCLEKHPDGRFQSARDLRFALESTLDGQTAGERAQPDEKSIAVLPFEDLSPDRSQQAFCEGMAAEIINALGAIDGLRVTSRTSAVRCREKGFDIAEIGARLNVQTVLEGTVRKAGERLRVTAQLVDARTGGQLWASRFDRGEGDIFDIQDEIALAIVDHLKVRLGGGSQTPMVKRPTDNLAAYNLYLKGRYYWERRNQQLLKLALEHFARAIAEDADFALAHAGVADCHTVSAILGFRAGRDVLPLARDAAERAIALDDSLAEAHHSLGAVRLFVEWDWDNAAVALSRAIALNPRLAISHLYRACLMAWRGQHDEAAQGVMQACELEPDSMLVAHVAGSVHYWIRRYELARTLIERSLELDPGASFPHWSRCPLLSELNEHEVAIVDTERAADSAKRPSFLISRLGRAYARAGRTADAERVLSELLIRRHTEYVAPLHLADIYAALGRDDQAFEWFEHSYDDRNGFLPSLAAEPFYDPFRGDPRFQALLARMNLA